MTHQTITSDHLEKYSASAMIANEDSEFYHSASILDHKGKIISLKSEIDLPPGQSIRIMVASKDNDDTGSEAGKIYWAVVLRCQEVLDGYTFNYGIRAHIAKSLN